MSLDRTELLEPIAAVGCQEDDVGLAAESQKRRPR
jgi:hypothetical protein